MSEVDVAQGLRDITSEEGSLLCFDEVMTGFRIAHGCAQQHFGITPDLTTMGKVIGEGLKLCCSVFASFLADHRMLAFCRTCSAGKWLPVAFNQSCQTVKWLSLGVKCPVLAG